LAKELPIELTANGAAILPVSKTALPILVPTSAALLKPKRLPIPLAIGAIIFPRNPKKAHLLNYII